MDSIIRIASLSLSSSSVAPETVARLLEMDRTSASTRTHSRRSSIQILAAMALTFFCVWERPHAQISTTTRWKRLEHQQTKNCCTIAIMMLIMCASKCRRICILNRLGFSIRACGVCVPCTIRINVPTTEGKTKVCIFAPNINISEHKHTFMTRTA